MSITLYHIITYKNLTAEQLYNTLAASAQNRLQNPALSMWFHAIFSPFCNSIDSPVDCARELIKCSKDVVSLLDCNEKKIE